MALGLLKKIPLLEVSLVILILFGVFFRFYNLNVPLNGDEVIFGISAIKTHQQSFEAGKDYVKEHPPLGKFIIGLPSIFIEADYEPLKLLGPDMFVWGYAAYDALSKNYVAIRVMEAVEGVAALFLIFLIGNRLFGLRAAIWSTVVASLSFEMVGYSRVIFLENSLVVFALLTLLLYLNYIKSAGKKRFLYLGLFFVSITATLLTRHIQPLFMLPIFAISQFVVNKDIKENIYFLILLGAAYYLVFTIIFPQDIIGFGQSRFGFSNALGFFSFRMHTVMGHLILRNSFLFLAALVASSYLVYRHASKKEKFDVHPTIIVFFILSFIIFSVLSFTLPRHYIFMFLPLYLISGYALDKITAHKILLWLVLAIAAFNVVQLAQTSPYFLTYSNFGFEQFQSFPNEEAALLEKRLEILNSEGTTFVISNDFNTLAFFKGDKAALPPSLGETCSNETMNSLNVGGATVLYVSSGKGLNFDNDPYICPLFKEKVAASNVKIIEG